MFGINQEHSSIATFRGVHLSSHETHLSIQLIFTISSVFMLARIILLSSDLHSFRTDETR